jgi:hypothetical protein
LAEAMLLGKPVIATNYSGNVDFMQNELAHSVEFKLIDLDSTEYQWVDMDDNAKWADCENISAISQLQKIRDMDFKAKKYQIPQLAANSVSPLMVAGLKS